MPYMASNTLEGSISSSGSGAGVSTDLESLGIDDSEAVFGGRIDLQGDTSHWSISHSSTSSSATGGDLAANLEIDGITLSGIVPVDTEMEVGATSVLWTHDWGLGDTAHFGLGFGVTALQLGADFSGEELGNPGVPVTASMDETLPVPLIGVRLGGDVGPIRLEASYAFLNVDAEDAEVSVTDFDVYTGLDILGDFGSLVVGYREFSIDAEFESDSDSANLDLTLGGPYAGVRFGF